MIIEQFMPAKSPTMTEGTIVAWRVKPGDQVKSGDVIAEIQTDKAVVEWEALDGGYVREIVIPAGALAQVNQVAAIFSSTPSEDVKAAVAKANQTNAKLASGAPIAAAAPAMAAAAAATPAQPMAAPAATPAPAPRTHGNGNGNGRAPRVSPVASRLAALNRIDLAAVKGTGPDGRIIKRDVERAVADGTGAIGAVAASTREKAVPKLKIARPDGPAQTDIPLTPMRMVIGKRLLQSKTSVPHFQITERVDCGSLVALREQLNAVDGVKISFNDLVVRATALALRQHPKLNATHLGEAIRQWDSADISIAVAISDGLITPILFKAHTLSVQQISEQVRVLSKKAADGKLKPNEYQGGTFTVSNLGMYGIESVNAIVNPPQAAILGVGGIKDEPVVRDGAVVPGKVMRMTISGDHRIVDGAAASEFLRTLRELLEAPAALLL